MSGPHSVQNIIRVHLDIRDQWSLKRGKIIWLLWETRNQWSQKLTQIIRVHRKIRDQWSLKRG